MELSPTVGPVGPACCHCTWRECVLAQPVHAGIGLSPFGLPGRKMAVTIRFDLGAMHKMELVGPAQMDQAV
jgi:hypothetical protein